jgi:hypothetical protein
MTPQPRINKHGETTRRAVPDVSRPPEEKWAPVGSIRRNRRGDCAFPRRLVGAPFPVASSSSNQRPVNAGVCPTRVRDVRETVPLCRKNWCNIRAQRLLTALPSQHGIGPGVGNGEPRLLFAGPQRSSKAEVHQSPSRYRRCRCFGEFRAFAGQRRGQTSSWIRQLRVPDSSTGSQIVSS